MNTTELREFAEIALKMKLHHFADIMKEAADTIDRMNADYLGCCKQLTAQVDENKRQDALLAKYREALEFYANVHNYEFPATQDGDCFDKEGYLLLPDAVEDNGKRARNALEQTS